MKNCAGQTGAELDAALIAELTQAGIPHHNFSFKGKEEVQTGVIGILHGWTFHRAWYYWIAEGPGIPVGEATELWELDKSVRVAGHCASPSPREWHKGFGVGMYHVDSQEGLTNLANTLNRVAGFAPPFIGHVQ